MLEGKYDRPDLGSSRGIEGEAPGEEVAQFLIQAVVEAAQSDRRSPTHDLN